VVVFIKKKDEEILGGGKVVTLFIFMVKGLKRACAYLKKTRIDPRNVALVEEHSENGNIRWFFAEKSQTKLGDKQF